MKRTLTAIILFTALITPNGCRAEDTLVKTETSHSYTADLSEKHTRELKEAEKLDVKKELPKVFVWQLPDNAFVQEDDAEDEGGEYGYDKEDTSIADEGEEVWVDEEIGLPASPLKGYINYFDNENAIFLDNFNSATRLKLSSPREYSVFNTSALKKAGIPNSAFAESIYSRSGNIEYNIAPVDASSSVKIGSFLFGTEYNESIDTSDLGFTTSIFTKYDTKYFSIKYAYNKNSGVSYSTVIDKFTLTPELKFNKYVSLKDNFTSDITRNRNKNELVLSLKPMKDDRLKFELGAGQTYDQSKALIKSEVKFSTQFKW